MIGITLNILQKININHSIPGNEVIKEKYYFSSLLSCKECSRLMLLKLGNENPLLMEKKQFAADAEQLPNWSFTVLYQSYHKLEIKKTLILRHTKGIISCPHKM